MMTAEQAQLLTEGRFIAIDPSSCSGASGVGWTVFNQGAVIASGSIHRLSSDSDVYLRLRTVAKELRRLAEYYRPQMLVMEQIRARAHSFLRFSCGVVIVCFEGPVKEIVPWVWRKQASPEHLATKKAGGDTDQLDSEVLGRTAIKEARAWLARPARSSRRGTRAKPSNARLGRRSRNRAKSARVHGRTGRKAKR